MDYKPVDAMTDTSSTGPELVARAAARLAGPPDATVLEAIAADLLGCCDWCAIDLVEEGRRDLRPAAFAHRDPAQAGRARAARVEHPLAAAPDAPLVHTEAGADPIARALGWSSWVVAPLVAQGHVLGALTLATSDPARRLGHDELELARTVATLVGLAVSGQQLARERDELLTVVSHDLRNPLGVILLVVDLLRQSAQPQVVSQMGRLERSAQNMGRILTDLVDAGRLGAATVPLETELVQASRIVTDACQAAQAAADQKGVVLDHSSVNGLELRADRARLTRMIDQLVQAAVGRAAPGQRVTVAVEPDGDGGSTWSVADPAPRSPAAQEDPPSRRAGAYGWLVARGVIRAHGGALWLERSGPDGTVLRFTLPAAPPPR